jgi:hypothetical protein
MSCRALPAVPALLCCLAAACGGGEAEPAGDPSPAELANRIEKVAVQREPEEEAAPLRLRFLSKTDVVGDLRSGPSCRLQRGGRLLLLANAAGALAAVDGRVVRLAVAGPVGPSGGFFEAPGVSISVGRRPSSLGGPPGPWSPAGVTVGGAPGKPVERHDVAWGCFAAGPAAVPGAPPPAP